MRIPFQQAPYALLAAAPLLLCSCSDQSDRTDSSRDYASLVNPFIGTDFTGNTYPGAQAPFGMVQLSPDNGLPGWDRIAGYFYPDSTIAGFSHTHLSGTGAGDLYDISFLPVTFPLSIEEGPLGIHSKFSHDSEQASAGYYRVTLRDYGIDVELTATERVGLQRYTFPGDSASVILNLAKAMNWDATVDTEIQVLDSVTVQGYRRSDGWARDQRVYFVSRFSKPFDKVTFDTTFVNIDGFGPGKGLTARFDFATAPGQQIVVATALSGVSMEGAMANLDAESPDCDFDKALASTRENWNRQLGRIDVSGGSRDDEIKFYTALYHAMLAPTIYSDTDGRYYGPDKKTHQADGWTNYSTFSLWDTFRASHPLFTIVEPDRVGDMVNSLLAFYDQNGRLPVWNMWGSETDMMIGYHAVPVIVDAYLKGLGDFDPEKALRAAIATSNINDYRGIGLYKDLGYIPYDIADPYNGEHGNWSLSRTLEYAYDDYCIARMAEKMGKDDIAREYYRRSLNYRNLFDPETRFMVPRDGKGRFQPDFNPDEYTEHICESNGWHYLWSVQHDIPGLAQLLGGRDSMESRLDQMFEYKGAGEENLPIFSTGMIGQYAHGNEPSHHVPYLYNLTGSPSKTQQRVSEIMNSLYLNTPSGICGNDDTGQMSAWFVLSAMGFYPVDPVSGLYEIGSPLFPELSLSVGDGRTFRILAPGVNEDKKYIKSVKVDGIPYHESYLTHSQIINGATVEFEMASTPQPAWF